MPARFGFFIEMKPSLLGPLARLRRMNGAASFHMVDGLEAIQAKPMLL